MTKFIVFKVPSHQRTNNGGWDDFWSDASSEADAIQRIKDQGTPKSTYQVVDLKRGTENSYIFNADRHLVRGYWIDGNRELTDTGKPV